MPVSAPSQCEVVFTEREIQSRVVALAAELDHWIASLKLSEGKDIVAMPVMRGSLFFYADLMRELSYSIEIVPVRTWGYTISSIGERLPEVRIELSDFEPRGKTILLVDEICDTGRTFRVLSERLVADGAKTIKTISLIHRLDPNSEFKPDWVGFEYPGREWLVGYGMEFHERFRNVKGIYR